MRKKWKRYKNRIMALGMALSISCSSVFLPSMEVMASSEVEQLEIKGVWEDKNGDGQMNVNEVNPVKLIASSFVRLGYWVDTGKEAFNNAVAYFQSWLDLGSDRILGWLAEDGLVYLNDDMWQLVRKSANVLTLNEGYTVYPALNSSKLYWYELSGANFSNDYFNSYISNPEFNVGFPISLSGSTYYFTSARSSYYDYINSNNFILVKSGSMIYPYYLNDNSYNLIRVSSSSYVSRYKLNSNTTSWSSINWTTDHYALAPYSDFLGLVGISSMVFESMDAAYSYYSYDRDSYLNSDQFVDNGIHSDVLNGKDWLDINGKGYEAIRNSVLDGFSSDSSFNDSNVQEIIKEYTEEVRSSLEFIEGEQVEQSTYLKAIYELLKEWLEKIFNKIPEEDEDNDFEDTSNNQSDKLDDLIQDSQVEKPDIDNTNQLVDENLDMGNVEEYGTLLSVFTGNQRILSFILISLTVGLIAYVFYGKR